MSSLRSSFTTGPSRKASSASAGADGGEPAQSTSSQRTVLKKGYAKKLKTMKSRYFVLSKDAVTGDVKLEYFDNHKKYEANNNSRHFNKKRPPIAIKECFSINKRVTSVKNTFALTIYTAEDSFSMLFDDEKEFSEWLDTLVQQKALARNSSLCHNANCNQEEQQPFEHVWQVELTKKGLVAQHPLMVGKHRLCLSPSLLYLLKVEPKTSDPRPPPLEFPLNAIRKCGHSDSYFSMELGRSSSLGPGDLLMLVDDGAVAHHMHKAIHEAMKSSTARDEVGPTSRPRSASTSDSSKALSSRRSTLSSLNPSHSHFSSFSGTPTTSTTLVAAHSSTLTAAVVTSTTSSDSIRDRSCSMHEDNRLRTRTVSEGNPGHYYSDISGTAQMEKTAGHYAAGMPSRTQSYSPPSNNPLSPSSGACSTDSAGSCQSITDYVDAAIMGDGMGMPGHRGDLGSLGLPTQPPIAEEAAYDDYSWMGPVYSSRTSSVGSTSAQHSHHRQYHRNSLHLSLPQNTSQLQSQKQQPQTVSYSPVPSPLQDFFAQKQQNPIQEPDEYVTMSPGSLENGSCGSRRSSSFMDRSLNYEEESENSYLEMKPGATSIGLDITPMNRKSMVSIVDEGYLDMAPLSSSLPKTSHILSSSPHGVSGSSQIYNNHTNSTSYFNSPPKFTADEFPLDKVKSYFSPTEEESFDLIKPARAYSIGSRPQVSSLGKSRKQLQAQLQQQHQNSLGGSSSSSPYTYAMPLNHNLTVADAGVDNNSRARAHSMGSQMGNARDRIRSRLKPSLEAVLGTIKQLEETTKTGKSSSAPLLAPVETHRARSSTCGSRSALLPVQERVNQLNARLVSERHRRADLMEIDYTKQQHSKPPTTMPAMTSVLREDIKCAVRSVRQPQTPSLQPSAFSVSVASEPTVALLEAAVPQPLKNPLISSNTADDVDKKSTTLGPVPRILEEPASNHIEAPVLIENCPIAYAEIDFKN